MPSTVGPAVQLTHHGGFEAVEAPDGKTLYYSKGYVNGLWTVPNTGGEERPVPALADIGHWRAWSMTRDGIYFIAKTGTSAALPTQILQLCDTACHANRYSRDGAVTLGSLTHGH